MRDSFRRLKLTADRHAPWLCLAGLVAVAWHNWRLWRRDRERLSRCPSAAASSPVAAWPGTPRVSVLVAAWNEAENIEAHIQSFLDLRYPNKELIVCAGGADGTYDLACPWEGLQVVVLKQRPGEGKQQALQYCLALASGTIIMLTDADCLFSEEAFWRLLEPLVRGAAAVVTGESEPKAHQRGNALVQYQWFNDLVRSHRQAETVDGLLGRNCALLRSALADAGDFSTPVPTGTDYFLSRRLTRSGQAIRFVPQSRVATDYPDTPRVYLRTWRRWDKNLLIHGLRFGYWKDVKVVLLALVLYSVIFLMPFLSPVLELVACSLPLFLFGAACANRLRRVALGARLAGTRLPLRCLISLPLCACLDMLAVLLAVRDAVDPGRRPRW